MIIEERTVTIQMTAMISKDLPIIGEETTMIREIEEDLITTLDIEIIGVRVNLKEETIREDILTKTEMALILIINPTRKDLTNKEIIIIRTLTRKKALNVKNLKIFARFKLKICQVK